LGKGIRALEDEVTREVFEARQKIKSDNLKEKISKVLKTLSDRKEMS